MRFVPEKGVAVLLSLQLLGGFRMAERDRSTTRPPAGVRPAAPGVIGDPILG